MLIELGVGLAARVDGNLLVWGGIDCCFDSNWVGFRSMLIGSLCGLTRLGLSSIFRQFRGFLLLIALVMRLLWVLKVFAREPFVTGRLTVVKFIFELHSMIYVYFFLTSQEVQLITFQDSEFSFL